MQEIIDDKMWNCFLVLTVLIWKGKRPGCLFSSLNYKINLATSHFFDGKLKIQIFPHQKYKAFKDKRTILPSNIHLQQHLFIESDLQCFCNILQKHFNCKLKYGFLSITLIKNLVLYIVLCTLLCTGTGKTLLKQCNVCFL